MSSKFFSALFFILACFGFALTAHADVAPPTPVGGKELKVTGGTISFLMDAPIEKIKGDGKIIGGTIVYDGKDFKTATGSVTVDVSTFKTFTFNDPGKDATQTEHMLNWFEIGPDVEAAKRERLKIATLTLVNVADMKEAPDGAKMLKINAKLTLHGITLPQQILLALKPTATGFTVTTQQPFPVGLAAHEVKPRDLAGVLLQKGLEALGEKVAKDAQVSVDATLQTAP